MNELNDVLIAASMAPSPIYLRTHERKMSASI